MGIFGNNMTGTDRMDKFGGGAIIDRPGGWQILLTLLLGTAVPAAATTVWFARQDESASTVGIKCAEKNRFGVMDHDVRMETGGVVHIPMRVVPNGEGSEFVFTLIRRPGMSDEKFAEDKAAVEKDLRALKGLLEPKSQP